VERHIASSEGEIGLATRVANAGLQSLRDDVGIPKENAPTVMDSNLPAVSPTPGGVRG